MIKFGIDRQDVLLQFRRSNILKFQRLDSIREETARALEHRIRITHQVDELGIGEHLYQFLHTPGMRRVLAEKLRTVRIPQGNLDESGKCFLKHLQLRLAYIVEQ